MTETGTDFNAIRISLASPEQVRAWSYGEVTKPETINYRTLRPEKDGLFCERIFGPTKDWECYCGKYKKIRYKGVVCDRCGVEIARAKVRRERMGHIKLAAPVAHIWFSKGTPSRLGLLLDLSPRNLERVLYFAQYIVTEVDEDARERAMESLNSYLEAEDDRFEEEKQAALEALRSGDVAAEEAAASAEGEEPVAEVEEKKPAAKGKAKSKSKSKTTVKAKASAKDVEPEVDEDEEPADPLAPQLTAIEEKFDEAKEALKAEITERIEELEGISRLDLLTEARYRELRDRYGEVFKATMGAESILNILKHTDLEKQREGLQAEVRSTSGQRRKKAIKRLRVVESFVKSGNKPEWMVITMLPVLPPELRPMVQLDGGRFATSDLNDLYRRVINRNNRLKRLLDLQAPDIIVRNEKRMLQEAVDALIDNGRRGRAISGSHNHKLKSLTDLLRGKQGRFRQNLLGKRVDYSGRSVIIVGPELRLHECGLPKKMALELFKPFVMNLLVVKGFAHNIKSAKRMAERARPEVWDILEEVIKNRPVLLNRAPTLHRLGIQAFQPVLVEGSAIKIHPLVCTAFNADFDGDQMAVHVPLSREAVLEAQRIMLSTNNMLSPASGDPIVSPTLDMVLGNFYLTTIEGEDEATAEASTEDGESEEVREVSQNGAMPRFPDFDAARLAHDCEQLGLRTPIMVRGEGDDGEWLTTSVGRIIFNDAVPDELGYVNVNVDRDKVKELVSLAYERLGNLRTADFLDSLKTLGFRYATQSGTTIAITDIVVPREKESLLKKADSAIHKLEEQYLQGLITEEERYKATIETWTKVSDEMTKAVEKALPHYGGIYQMAASGAKGNIAQIKQMAGMRGLMSDPKGRIIDLPIRSSFREGLSVLEYFISTHGGRKGLADTALRTADSGYLTRRLADVAQDVIVLFEDCRTRNGTWIQEAEDTATEASLRERAVGRFPAAPVIHPETGEVLADENTLMQANLAQKIVDAGVKEMYVRSPLSCEATRGLCRKCYGASLATGETALLGEAAGIIAAQSIGEPGTQLTMRTFHTGGIAGLDITSGLPRVEELFEARTPRGVASITEIDGVVEVVVSAEGREVKVSDTQDFLEELDIPDSHKPLVKTGEWVDVGMPILGRKKIRGKKTEQDETALMLDDEIVATAAGVVKVTKTGMSISWEERDERVYQIPAAAALTVRTGDTVTAGDQLTAGPKNPQDILRIEGHETAQRYIISQVQAVYRSQGVPIHDKHIEVIIRQMLRKVRVDVPGDTDLLPGELIDRLEYERRNARILAEGGEPATASPVLLGVTRASLNTESFLAAASFQETARVLTEAAVNGAVDHLLGLKENVIIGRLIPARLDRSEEGRKKLGLDTLGPRIKGTLSGTTEAPPTFEEALRAFGAEDDFISRGGDGPGAVDPSVLGARPTGEGDEVARAAQAFSAKKESSEEDLEAAAAAESLLASTSGDAASVLGDGGDGSEDGAGSADAESDTEAETETEDIEEKEPAGD
ncbi:MAG: DNA-directed RNA polymerase subunit beta' [Chloroflexi bacterium]|nr:DNA-directed RNA polymerase subunit beta' [Chloroflexota bacterium]